MQLDELFLLMLLVLHLLVLAVPYCPFCGNENVTYVPTNMRKVSSTIRFRMETSQDNGKIHCTGVRAVRISPQNCTPAGAPGLLIGRLVLCRFQFWKFLSSEGVLLPQKNQIASQAVFASLVMEASLVPCT